MRAVRSTRWLCWSWLAILAGCADNKPTAAPVAAPRPRVTVVKPQRKTIRRTVTQPGQIEAFDQAKLYAKIPAFVDKYHVDLGDEVTGPRFDESGKITRRGQLLAELSAPELERDVQQKQSLVAQAGAEVEQAQAAVKVAQANARSAEAQLKEAQAAVDRVDADYRRWNSEYDRVVQLVSRSAVTQKLADETKAQLQAAEAARKEAEAKIESARAAQAASLALVEKSTADEAAIRARRNVVEAEEERAEALVDYLKIEAPFDGVISERNADIGYFADAGGGGGKPLFTVVRRDTIRVFVDLPEMDATLANPGDRAVIHVQSLPGREFVGAVTRTAWALDASTRTLRTEVDVPNADGTLRPGMYAQVSIDLDEHQDAIVVPATAMVVQNNRAWCFVVEGGKAIRKEVEQGIRSEGEVSIAAGLRGDEAVIKDKVASLASGQEVDIVEDKPAR